MTSMIRIMVLALFSIYAISPIYLSAATAEHPCPLSCGEDANEITVGIVWVNVVLTALVDDGRDAETPSGMQCSAADQNSDLFLIKKKRAVVRQSHDPKPQQGTVVLSDSHDLLEPAAQSLDFPRDLCHWFENGPQYLHFGLSPPPCSRS